MKNLLASFLLLTNLCGALRAHDFVLITDKPLPAAAKRAYDELSEALREQQHTVRPASSLEQGDTTATLQIVIGVAGQSPVVDATLNEAKVTLSNEAESLAIQWHPQRPRTLIVAGRDARGLAYALRDLTRGFELASPGSDLASQIVASNETPFSKVRAVTVHLFNADNEKEWYFSDEFWSDYFRQLSLHRFNQLTLTFSDQTNYLCPAYAYLVDMPEYPSVKVRGLSVEERQRNLRMLQRITELAGSYGVDFNFGIWMQAPIPKYSAEVRVANLPEGLAMADYCAKGIRRVLEACPGISGVQFRMNAEAGVPEDQQTKFYTPLFQAIKQVGRPLRLDLRYKGLQPTTTQAAITEGLNVTVSTKFWSEHFGLPYHPSIADSHYRESRYSFGSMLKKPHDYRVIYRLWNVGSNRITLWGDPDYAARFAEACQLGGGEGFEIFAPLSDKGYGDRPGAWSVIKDPALRVGKWEQDRYWFFYLCFGRLGYNPQSSAQVWQRELQGRFKDATAEVEAAYRSASQVLPFITAICLPGASEWSWWPEMDTGGKLQNYMYIQPSDTTQFYALRSWKGTSGWRWEPWDVGPGYVDDVIRGQLRGKWTPPMIRQRLLSLAATIDRNVAVIELKANKAAGSKERYAEWQSTLLDFRSLSALAKYHAHKLEAATQLAFFEVANQPGRLPIVKEHLTLAANQWKELSTVTSRLYNDDLVFGVVLTNARNKFGHHHSGHWRDRLPEIEEDLKTIDSFIAKHRDRMPAFKPFPLENAEPNEYVIEHSPPKEQSGAKDFDVHVRITGKQTPRKVLVRFRSLDQTRNWNEAAMKSLGEGQYQFTISSKQIESAFDFQYYFEILDDAAGTRWPNWETRAPYFVLHTTK